MPHDVALAARVERILRTKVTIVVRKMFGGVCYLSRGHMICGVERDRLVVRVGPDAYESALREKHARPMDFTGRPLKGFIYVEPEGLVGAGLSRWIAKGLAFIESLPPKKTAATPAQRRK